MRSSPVDGDGHIGHQLCPAAARSRRGRRPPRRRIAAGRRRPPPWRPAMPTIPATFGCSRAETELLATAVDHRLQRRRPLGRPGARPLGAPELVPGERDEVGAEYRRRSPGRSRRPARRRCGPAPAGTADVTASAILRTGWRAPVSLLAAITDTTAVPSLIASTHVVGRPRPRSARPAPPPPARPSAPRNRAASSTASCSTAVTTTRPTLAPCQRRPGDGQVVGFGAARR